MHGHGQCRSCGTNTEPCCSGDVSGDACEVTQTPPRAEIGPGLFRAVFDALGGKGASVTTEAVCFALQQRLGCDLEGARRVLLAASRAGWLRSAGPGTHRLGAGEGPEVD